MSSKRLPADTAAEPIQWDVIAALQAGGTPATGSLYSSMSPPPDRTPAQGGGGGPGGDPAANDEAAAVEVQFLERKIGELEQKLRDERKLRETESVQCFERGRNEERAQTAARWNEALDRVNRSLQEMATAKVRYRREVEEDAVRLALAISRKILNREISVDPEALGGIVRVALDKLNQRELHRVRVHSEDAVRVREQLSRAGCPQRVEVMGEAGLERGAVVFETERGELDASVTTQLAEIDRGLTDLLRNEQR